MAKTYNLLDISFSEEARIQMVKIILGYESVLRGLSSAQAFAQIVEEAIDLESYPDEVVEQIDAIREMARMRAVEKSREVFDLRKSA